MTGKQSAPSPEQSLMDFVGETLMSNHDACVEYWLEILHGEEELNESEKAAKDLYNRLGPDERKLLESIIKETSRRTLTYLLLDAQQSDANLPDALYFGARHEGVEYPDIAYCSDSLGGEMMTEDGWLARFSEHYQPGDENRWIK